MTEYVYHMQGVSKAWPGGRKLFENINLSFLPDAKIGVVGANGAGKSTLLRIMSGQDAEFTGEAAPAAGVKIGYLPQEPQLDSALSVGENVAALCREKQLFDAFNAASLKLAEDYSDAGLEQMNALQEQIETLDAWDIDSRIEMAMEALRCPPADAMVDNLSGGEARRIAICRLLLSKPDMILMDEPTNHLDAETVAWLQAWLADFPGCVILVTHDRYFLDQITGWILEIDRGRGIPYKGNYSSWLEQKAKRLQQENREETGRKRILARELEWINSSPGARRAKSKARIKAYAEMAAGAEQIKSTTTRIRIPPGERLGDLVLETENLQKTIAGRILISELSFRLPPGAIAGIIGPNGAGKTSLLRMIAGNDTPCAGNLRLGQSVRIGYVDQSRHSLTDANSVWEEISGGKDVLEIAGEDVNSRAYVGSFNFQGPDQQKRVGKLSGGERNRVHLAKMLRQEANLLLLDEPTNDLDVETLQSLEAALEDFPGCALITSHDRWFLDRIATHILAFEGDGHVEWFEGDFSSYMEDKRKRLGPDLIERTAVLRKFSRI